MFHKYRVRSLKVFLTVSQYSQESIYFGVFYLKSCRLVKKRLRHSFPCVKCFKNTYFEGPLQVAVNDDSK